MFTFFTIIVFVFGFYFHVKESKWTSGKFPQDLKFTESNLMKSYMAICVSFVFLDSRHAAAKQKMLNQFLFKKFKKLPDDYDYYLRIFLKKPTHPVSVAAWISRHSKQDAKVELFQFLIKFCLIDGTFNKREYDALKIIASQFKIDPLMLDKWIDENQGTSGRTNQGPKTVATLSARRKHARILGVDENAPLLEIKNRYRALVKMYHPDRFSRESKEIQQDVHQKFIEIQTAYEFFQK